MFQKQTYRNASTLHNILQEYYMIGWLRVAVNIIYVLNQILLSLYLLFVPIQISYHWLLSTGQDAKIQTGIDISVLILFLMHIVLYFDEKFYQILKNPYARIWKKLITLEFIYDIFTVILAIYAVAIVKKSLAERVVEVIFYLKIYKLIKFDLKAMYFVIGTSFYTVYKVIRTLLIVFMAIAFVGSLFYGVAYLLYVNNVYVDMLWIVSCPAINDCVGQPFIIQLQYAMYWALGTASTAAYGDISATQPTVVLVNIAALAFEGFLFGFYLNSMHSIPLQNRKKEADLLHKFDSFQQHSSNRKLDNKLYLQILCSLEYTQSQKRSLESIQKVIPHKYIQQIKYNIYADFLNKEEYFKIKHEEYLGQGARIDPNNMSNVRDLQQQFLFSLTDIVQESICQIHENVYNYKDISHNHLLFVKQGSLSYSISSCNDQSQGIGTVRCEAGDCLGVYGFYTGLIIPQKAICTNYSIIYSISRQKFKQSLKKQQKLSFFHKFITCILFQESLLLRQPILNFIQYLQLNNSVALSHIYSRQKYFDKLQNKLQETVIFQTGIYEKKYERSALKSKKVMSLNSKTKNQVTQTQKMFEDDLLNFLDSYDQDYDQFQKSLDLQSEKNAFKNKNRTESKMPEVKKRDISALQIQIL